MLSTRSQISDVLGMVKCVDVTLEGLITPPDDTTIIIVLDTSRAMESMKDAVKKAICDLIESCQHAQKFILITYAGFEKKIETFWDTKIQQQNYRTIIGKEMVFAYDLRNVSIKEIHDIVNDIEFTGGLSHRIGFNAVETVVNKIEKTTSVKFLFINSTSDTETESDSEVEDAYSAMVSAISKFSSTPQFACIGVGPKHDSINLARISILGPKGVYFNAQDVSTFMDRMKKAETILRKTNIVCKMKNIPKKISYDVVLTWIMNKKTGRFYGVDCNFTDTFEFSYGSQQKTICPEPGTEIEDYLDIVHEYVATIAIENVNMLLNGSGELVELVNASEQISEIGNKLAMLYAYIQDKYQDVMKYSYLQQVYGIYATYVQFRKFFEKGLNGEVNNSEVASIFDDYSLCLYKYISFVNKDYEMPYLVSLKNTDMDSIMSNQEAIIEELSGLKQLFKLPYDEKHMIWKKDSFAIAYYRESDGSVSAICPDLVSCAEFYDAIKFAEKTGKSCVFENGDVQFNCVFPIVSDESYQKIVDKWIHILHGDVIRDIGLKNFQRTEPYELLHTALKILNENDSSKNKCLVQYIMEIASSYMKNDSIVQKMIKDCLANYASGSSRTDTCIKSNKILILQILVAAKLEIITGDETCDNFVSMIVEEELRRVQKTTGAKISMEFLCKLFDIKEDELNDNVSRYYTENVAGMQWHEKNKVKDALKEAGKLIEIDGDDEPFEWDGSCKETDVAKDLCVYISNVFFKKVYPNLKYVQFFPGFNADKLTLESCGYDTIEKMLALILQNYVHSDKKARHCAFKSNTYFAPYDQTAAKEFLKKFFADVTQNEISRKKAMIKKECDMVKTMAKVTDFANTRNMDEAGAILEDVYIGKNIMMFVKELQTRSCAKATSKIEMLLTGSYTKTVKDNEGNELDISINLFKDKGGKKWVPSKKNCYRLWKTNKHVVSEREWKTMFETIGAKAALDAVDSWIKFSKKTTSTTYSYNSQAPYYNQYPHYSPSYSHVCGSSYD